MSPLRCAPPPSIYAHTAAAVVRLLTSRLAAGRAEVEWDEGNYDDDDEHDADDSEDEDPPDNGSATGLVGGNTDYAPRGPPKVRKPFAGAVPPQMRVRLSRRSPVGKFCTACAVGAVAVAM